MADFFFLQRSGELVTKVGFSAKNEIIHTLAFLAGAMVWSQVLITHLPRPYIIYVKSVMFSLIYIARLTCI